MKNYPQSVGFTGTQGPVTQFQSDSLRRIINVLYNGSNKSQQFHHGDCIGSDHLAHLIAFDTGFEMHVHPPKKSWKRVFLSADVLYDEKDYLDRNQDIVDSCEVLIACPKETQEMLRSGTWSTLRRCWEKKKPYIILYPDGRINIRYEGFELEEAIDHERYIRQQTKEIKQIEVPRFTVVGGTDTE